MSPLVTACGPTSCGNTLGGGVDARLEVYVADEATRLIWGGMSLQLTADCMLSCSKHAVVALVSMPLSLYAKDVSNLSFSLFLQAVPCLDNVIHTFHPLSFIG